MTHIFDWDELSKKVYWDRDVPLDRWKSRVAEGHRSYFPDAIKSMTPAEFAHFYGVEKFKADWPRLRGLLPCELLRHAALFDVAWSKTISGSWNLCPVTDFFEMPEKRRAFYIQVSRMPGKSIYAICKSLGLQYRRGHDHARALRAQGIIRFVDAISNGRHALRLYPLAMTSAGPLRRKDE
ncbi:MAG: hypothetical protein Q8O64_05840 [Sideroxyarcus sp.]|nr:hypothetical protein [Sideroxyarcus sp.]